MERLLRNDNRVKLLSLALSIMLWFYVSSEQNPTISRTIQEIPVEVRGLGVDLAVVNLDPEAVTVTVQGPAQVVNNLDRSDFRASVQLADAGAGPVVAAVRLERPQGIQLTEVQPPHVITLIEPVEEVSLPVELAVRGQPAPDFRAGEARLSSRRVVVRGAASLVARIERVVTTVDIAAARETVSQSVTVYALDAAGRQVNGVRLIPDRVTVNVPVEPLPPLVVLPVRVALTGEPAAGYRVAADPTVVPGHIVVRAPAGQPGLGAVSTEPVDITDARQPVEMRVPVILPEGIEPVGAPEVLVYVPVAAEPEPGDDDAPEPASGGEPGDA